MMENGMSPADLAAVTGRNNNGDGMFGGNGAWWIIILFLFVFCGWGGGWGNNAGRGQGTAMDGFYAQAQLVNGVQMQMANGFGQAELSRSNQQAALMQQLNNMAMQAADCCCKTQTAIQGVNYNLATQACETRNTIQNGTRDIIENQNCNARAILDAMTAQRIEAKDEKIAAQSQQIFGLQLAASQAAQNQYLVQAIRPCPTPAYVVANPYCCNQQLCGG